MTAAGIQSITNAIKCGDINVYSNIAYHVEEGDAGLAQVFTEAGGVTVKYFVPYGITDAAQPMNSFFSNSDTGFIWGNILKVSSKKQAAYLSD